MNESLSFPEILKRSKSITLQPKIELDTKTIKQIGDYTLGAEVGSGAFGKVVLGKHTLTGESVAIKILDKIILSQTPEDYELVKQEISILKIVKHKYIVQLYEILETPQHIYIIMEYCEGKDMMDFILSKQHLSELESLKFFQQLINALFYLHSQNIAHRDVKIDNMLLDKNKDLKLVDFGLSTKYSDDILLDQPCGTVVYAAPEVLDGNEYHGMLADVWSSGIVLYGMASGYLPFSDKDDEINKKNVLEGNIDIPEFFSPLLKDLLRHMLDVNPITRYTLQEIKQHPWFNLNKVNLIPGIIIGYNKIPVDENILNLCVTYNANKDKVKNSVKNNKYDKGSALYYLLVKKITKKGFQSVSDLNSELFIEFILDNDNLIKKNNYPKRKYSNKINSRNNNKPLDFRYNNSLNVDCIYSSSRNNENLSAAPRLMPSENNNYRSNKKGIVVGRKKRNKVNSVVKANKIDNNDYNKCTTKNSGDFNTKKKFIQNKNEIRIKQDKKSSQKRINNSANMRTKYMNKVNLDKYDNNTFVPFKEETTLVKSKQTRDKNNTNNINLKEGYSLEFKSITEKVDLEIKNKKTKNNKKENKSPIKDIKKYVKHCSINIEQKNSNKNSNAIDDSININKTLEKNLIRNNIKNMKKVKIEEYSVNSCINIKTNNYLKTPNKINNNAKMNKSIQTSHKNIYNNERNSNKNNFGKKGNYLNTSTSDKFTCFKYYTKNKQDKNISKSVYNKSKSKYNESKIKDESKIIFASNKKRDYSLINKKNNMIRIDLSQNNKKKKNEIMLGNEIYDSSKYFLSNKKKKQKLNSLNLSLNKSTSDYPNQIKNHHVIPFGAKKRKQTEYKIDNTIYELNCNKNKNKNRIRLNYYFPKNKYEITTAEENKKKNRLNKSVTIGKTDEKKMTGLSIYMNNYNTKQRIKRINLESSVLTNRNVYSNTIRDLSYSPNQKYLNEKTRKERIPWKYQKKGIDNKLSTESIYNRYMTRISKNPLNINGNKKIKNLKKQNIINENNNIVTSSTIQAKKEKRRLSQERRGRHINNSHQRNTSNSKRNIQEQNKFSTKQLNISISTKNKINSIENILPNKKNNNSFNIFDLSCLVVKEKSLKECSQNLVNKLKKNGFNVLYNKVNEIKCSKNKINCEINICKIKNDSSDTSIFYYKINNKRSETLNSKIISKLISFS